MYRGHPGEVSSIAAALLRLGAWPRPTLDVLGQDVGSPRRVGILPGSFDPMTVAHAALADSLGDLGCDCVLLVYSPRTMPKEGPVEPPLLTPEARVASVAAWCSARAGSAVALCSHGLYADQVRAVAEAFPASELVVALGSDKVLQLLDPAWYRDRDAALADLFGRARVAYAARAGDEGRVGRVLEEEAGWAQRLERLEMPSGLADVSSSEVRRRIGRGEDVDALVPAEVLPYVRVASSPPESS